MPRQAKRQSKAEIVRRNKHYKRLEIGVHARISAKTPTDLAVAYAIADLRHVCDDLRVDFEIANRIAGVYYTAEVGGSLR
jgi:hypothetical protein